MKTGKFQIYTGNGKGKTTAAFGLCFRALGRDLRVKIVQLRKSRECGELIQAKRCGIDIKRCPEFPNGEPCTSPCPMLNTITKIIENNETDLLVIDEMMEALRVGCLKAEDAAALVRAKPEGMELVMTGRNVPEELLELADLVTSMELVKHYYKDGLDAREGIEY